MKAGRELDRIVAQTVMGRAVTQQKREVFESTDKGTRPLAHYTTDITAAWEVAEYMAITLVPVQDNAWFALVGRNRRWKSPAEFIQFLGNEDFLNAGAAVGESAALTICQAALNAVKNKEAAAQTSSAAAHRASAQDAFSQGARQASDATTDLSSANANLSSERDAGTLRH